MCSKRRLAVQDYFHEGFKPKSESQTIRTRGQTCLALTFTTQEINSKKRPKKERKAFLVKELIFQDLMVTQLSSLLLSTHALNRRRSQRKLCAKEEKTRHSSHFQEIRLRAAVIPFLILFTTAAQR